MNVDKGKNQGRLALAGRDVPWAKWWGAVELAVGDVLQRSLGDVHFCVQRQEQEWLISRWMDVVGSGSRKSTREKSTTEKEETRFFIPHGDSRLHLSPALADRSVVSRPLVPVTLLPKTTSDFYVSTPLWLTLASGGRKQMLVEFPTVRLSDTWFGPNTRVGELCYMSRTEAFTQLDCLPVREERIITPVRVINDSDESLNVSRINLAVQHLSILADEKNRLWTERAILINKGEDSLFEFRVDKAKHLMGVSEKLSEPRIPLRRNRLTQTWNFLLGSE